MIDGCVTLDEVFAAAGMRAASLVPETSGYLALAVGDATSRLPFAIDPRLVLLTTEGNVGITKRGELLPPRQAARGLREILARLLTVSTGSAMPSLSAAARPREESDRGVDAVVDEIEAALIPVNRAAARRALARLARETIKARDSGRLRRPSARPPAEPPRAAATASPPVVIEPPAPPVVIEPPAPPVVVEPRAQPVVVEPPAPPIDVEPLAAAMEDEQLAGATTPPPEDPRDPTPTVLGMAHMEGYTILDVATAQRAPEPSLAEPADDSAPTGLPESTVLAQPTEDPSLAFERGRRVERPLDALTPLYPFEIAPPPRGMPAIQAAAPEPRPSPAPSAPCAPPPRDTRPTRADDLLARFGASCVDDDHMREAAACLRRIAGLDATPPPPAHLERSLPAPSSPALLEPPTARVAAPETAAAPRATRRRGLTGASLGLTLVALLVGVAGGGAVMHFRPDLVGAQTRPAAPLPAAKPAPLETAPALAPTAEPTGAAPPLGERLGGTRAERSSGSRAR